MTIGPSDGLVAQHRLLALHRTPESARRNNPDTGRPRLLCLLNLEKRFGVLVAEAGLFPVLVPQGLRLIRTQVWAKFPGISHGISQMHTWWAKRGLRRIGQVVDEHGRRRHGTGGRNSKEFVHWGSPSIPR